MRARDLVASGMIGLLVTLTVLIALRDQPIQRVVLLAPFEGRYREVGYEALYAVRLALAEHAPQEIELLAIDDGGSVETAVLRAAGIAQDHASAAIILTGPYAVHPDVQRTLPTRPTIIAGHWNSRPQAPHIVSLSTPTLHNQLTFTKNDVLDAATASGPIISSEVLALDQFATLRTDPTQDRLMTSARSPAEAFTARYTASDPFAPVPGVFATLAYDATLVAIRAIMDDISIRAVQTPGTAHDLHFDQNGYWLDAPLMTYHIEPDGALIQSTRPSTTP